MTPVDCSPIAVQLLQRIYTAFNQRDVEAVLKQMHADVDWPNGWEGGRVRGHAAVRDYWRRQFEVLNPRVEPQRFRTADDGRIVVDVHQVVHDHSGKLLVDQDIQHVYELQDGLIRSMEIRSENSIRKS